MSLRGVVSGHLERSHEICHYYWPVALFPLTNFSSSQPESAVLGTVKQWLSLFRLSYITSDAGGCEVAPLTSRSARGSLRPPPPERANFNTSQNPRPPPPPPPVASQPTLLRVTIGSLSLRRDGPAAGQGDGFPAPSRGGAIGHTGGSVAPASVLLTPCTALALTLPQEQTFRRSSAPLFISPFLLTPGPTETRFRKLSQSFAALDCFCESKVLSTM